MASTSLPTPFLHQKYAGDSSASQIPPQQLQHVKAENTTPVGVIDAAEALVHLHAVENRAEDAAADEAPPNLLDPNLPAPFPPLSPSRSAADVPGESRRDALLVT